MGDASILRRGTRRGVWVWSMTVAAAVSTMAALDLVGRTPDPPLLRASFIGAPAMPDVRLEPTAAAPAAPAAAAPPAPAAAPPARRPGPIDVPDDPYAREAIVEIGTIEIPRLGVRRPLMHGITLRNIDIAPSHWPGTAMAGEAGNMVVAGHRVTHGRPFRNIDQLETGDPIFVSTGGEKVAYRVSSSFVVTPDRTDIADPTPTPTLTLFACHPPGSARQRYVVRAELVATPAL